MTSEESGVNFKTYDPEDDNSGLDDGFKVTRGEESDIKVEAVDLQMSGYVSPEVTKRGQFKHYNNTYVYVSFREKHISLADP